MQYKSIQNLQTLEGYIFRTLQHFATKLCNNLLILVYMLFLAVVIYLLQGRILRRGVERCAPPLRSFCTSPENFYTSPERSCTSSWELVSMMEQSENVMVA